MIDRDKNKNLRSFSIRVISDYHKRKLRSAVYDYRQFENLFLLFLNENEDDFKIKSDYNILRSMLYDIECDDEKTERKEIFSQKYSNNKWFLEMKVQCEKLKMHNVVMLIRRVKCQYSTFFTNIKKGVKASVPKPKKLSKMSSYSIVLDTNAWSFKKKNVIGININEKMFYIKINKDEIKKITSSLDNIQNVTISFSNKEVYLNITYHNTKSKNIQLKEEKFAGIDIGVKNTATCFVNDEETKSLICDGKQFIQYNNDFNRFLAMLNGTISECATEWVEKNGIKYPTKYNQQGYKKRRFRTFLYEKRNRFFFSEFHKLSRRIIDFLKISNVTHLIISYNLASLKYNGECDLDKAAQSFIQIPVIKLLKYIECKCAENGIVVDIINEANTSKNSCLSDDVNHPKTNGLNGVRVKRGLFKDRFYNIIFNADINGAVNHIKKFTKENFDWLIHFKFKLCNPVKISCDADFNSYLNRLSGKGVNSFTSNVNLI